MDALIDYLPLWLILPLTIVVSLLSVEVGYRIGGYRRPHSLVGIHAGFHVRACWIAL
jgi:hypothetical protein